MNNDRFLTRVFDKQEKKMLYCGDDFFDEDINREVRIISVTAIGVYVLVKGTSMDDPLDGDCRIYTFKDRYIPMLCTGFREDYGYENVEDGRPAFEFDIIKSHMSELFIILQQDGCWVANLIRGKKIINRPVCDLATLEGHFSIKGNKFEQPELLEQNK